LRRFAIWTSFATILILCIVIVLGVVFRGDTPLFGPMLTALHVVLPISSILMLVLLVRDRYWTGAALFAFVVIGMLAVATMRVTGPKFSGAVHLAGDVLVLIIYLIVVPRYRSSL
jgi:hypothetical protein